GIGRTSLGFMNEPDQKGWQKLEEAGRLFAIAGFNNVLVSNIQNCLWEKLLVNAAINGLTVIYDCNNGGLLADQQVKELMSRAIKEGAAVARTLGIDPGPDPVTYTREVCTKTAENISSMLQDIRRGKSTEISAINGALVAKAEALGIEAPVNRMIADRVREIERQRCQE
ncbi:MAG: ketopantoate reductase family protein, partial [Thermodesulfobacteriota bacterium]